jgi:protein disulfide-isomerase
VAVPLRRDARRAIWTTTLRFAAVFASLRRAKRRSVYNPLARNHALHEIDGVKLFRLLPAFAFVFALLVAPALRAEEAWLTDYKKAQEEAKTNHKLLLLNFTGSDWCGWCIKLDKDVFSKPEFRQYASKNLVLLTIDFPRAKQQPAEVKRQNQGLASQYQVEGFPTIVVLNGDGRKVWEYPGYFPDGASAFIAELEKARKG